MNTQHAANWGQPFGGTPMTPAEPRRLPVTFTGSGGEYFRIWIVNLLLTIVTLGIYSAWAKVRRLQYFYRNTHVDGAVFDYHGRPWAILKGRLIVLVLLFAYNFAFRISLAAGLVTVLALAVAMPWLFAQSQRFRLHNSSYRGLRFRFHGTTAQAYALFGLPFLIALAIGAWFLVTGTNLERGAPPPPAQLAVSGIGYLVLLAWWPWLHYRFKRYQHANAALGSTRAEFFGRASSFYKYYGAVAGVVLAIAGVFIGIASAGVIPGGRSSAAVVVAGVLAIVFLYAAILSIGPYLASRVQNHVWNNTRLGDVSFESAVRARRLVWIVVSNLVLIMLTLGLFTPFAAVRVARYKLESVTVVAQDDLANFVGAAGADVAAIGEGAADLFDVDFAL